MPHLKEEGGGQHDGRRSQVVSDDDDIVDGLIKIWETESYGHTFELGRGRKFSLQEVAELYKPSFGIVYQDDKKGEAQSVECDTSLAKKLLNWEPKLNLEDWISR